MYIVHAGSVSILCHAHIPQNYILQVSDAELIMVQHMSYTMRDDIKIYTACTLAIFVMFMYVAIEVR